MYLLRRHAVNNLFSSNTRSLPLDFRCRIPRSPDEHYYILQSAYVICQYPSAFESSPHWSEAHYFKIHCLFFFYTIVLFNNPTFTHKWLVQNSMLENDIWTCPPRRNNIFLHSGSGSRNFHHSNRNLLRASDWTARLFVWPEIGCCVWWLSFMYDCGIITPTCSRVIQDLKRRSRV